MSATVLRPFAPDDYNSVVAVLNAADPEYPFTVDELQSRDARRPDNMYFARWVAVNADGRTVGVAEYDQRPDMYHPRKWQLLAYVHPTVQGQGIGTQLLDLLEHTLQAQGAISVRGFVSETRPRDMAFLTGRGYRECLRDGAAMLDISGLDVSETARREAEAAAKGIAFRTLNELADDPHRDSKLCVLHNAFIADIPPRGERTPMDLATFRVMQLQRPDALPDAHFVAVTEDGRFVGVSNLRLPPDRDRSLLFTGITGVLPSLRGQTIALGLKWMGVRYAKEAGVRFLRTWNAADNEPVLALNRKLGFVREPWSVHFAKEFDSEDHP